MPTPAARVPEVAPVHAGARADAQREGAAGRLEVVIRAQTHVLTGGDLVYLTVDTPSGWKNPGRETACLLWLKLNV